MERAHELLAPLGGCLAVQAGHAVALPHQQRLHQVQKGGELAAVGRRGRRGRRGWGYWVWVWCGCGCGAHAELSYFTPPAHLNTTLRMGPAWEPSAAAAALSAASLRRRSSRAATLTAGTLPLEVLPASGAAAAHLRLLAAASLRATATSSSSAATHRKGRCWLECKQMPTGAVDPRTHLRWGCRTAGRRACP